MTHNGAIVVITKWDEYQPRKDIKASVWFRLQNTLFEDPNFFDFTQGELLFWIYILSMASKKQSGEIRFNTQHATKIGRFTEEQIESAMVKLQALQCVRVTSGDAYADVTCTLRVRDAHVTLQTDKQTDTDVRTRTHAFDLEALYNEYPTRKGSQRKADALKTLTKRIKTQEDYDQHLEAIRNYAAEIRATNRFGTEYVQQFATFINRTWTEYLTPSLPASSALNGELKTDMAALKAINSPSSGVTQ